MKRNKERERGGGKEREGGRKEGRKEGRKDLDEEVEVSKTIV
jgi:hypothetical protein